MAPRRKARGWLTASDRPDHQCHHHHHHHHQQHQKIEPQGKTPTPAVAVTARKKAQEYTKAIDEPNAVEEWVYRFLGNLAAVESDKKEAKKRVTHLRFRNIKQPRGKKKPFRRFRSPTPYSWDRVSPRSPVAALREPADSDMSLDEREPMDELDNEEGGEETSSFMGSPRLPDVRTSPAPGSVPLRDPPLPTANEGGKIDSGTLLQKINGYIRAGIAEGKRRAKHYVRKALSFALETGYLIPADREGKLLRVSPALISNSSQHQQQQQQQQTVIDAASQRRRRTTRRVGSRRRARTMRSSVRSRARTRRASRRAATGRSRVTDDKKLEGKVKIGRRKRTSCEAAPETKVPENQQNDERDSKGDKPAQRSREAITKSSSSSVVKAPARTSSSKDDENSNAPITLPAGTTGTRAASADIDRKPKIQPLEHGRSRSASTTRSSRKSSERRQQR